MNKIILISALLVALSASVSASAEYLGRSNDKVPEELREIANMMRALEPNNPELQSIIEHQKDALKAIIKEKVEAGSRIKRIAAKFQPTVVKDMWDVEYPESDEPYEVISLNDGLGTIEGYHLICEAIRNDKTPAPGFIKKINALFHRD